MDRGEKQQLSVSKSSRHHRSNEWIFRDVPSDITLEVNGTIFSLHKFPLVSRSGRIRRVVAEHRDTEISRVELVNLPGGAEAFELAAKFCYGVNFEITAANVAELLCVSDYLEMTEEHSKGNLVSRAEEYLDGVVCRSLELSVEVLRQCESLTPLAEELRVVCRCVEAVAAKACAEQIASSFSRLEYSSSGRLHMARHAKSGGVGSVDGGDWWIEDISALRVDIYRQVIAAMKCRGVRPESIGASLVRYATKELSSSAADSDPKRQLAVVETVVGLLPAERQAVPISFLFGLLRATTAAMSAARPELERRIGARLDEAALDDLLIPSSSSRHHAAGENTLFDVDAVHRIVACFSQRGDESDDSEDGCGDDVAGLGTEFGSECGSSPTQTAVLKVGRLVDSYLAEIAADSNLKLAKFVAIADALPPHARTLHDGLYRAIDIYLKAHGKVTEAERRRVTKLIDFQRLSQEAGAHAAQNERLPLQSVVQVLYIEQVRLRNSVISDEGPTKSAMGSPRDNYASLRRENRELKLELARLRMRLNDLERDHISMKRDYIHNNSSNSSLAANFLSSFSRIWGRRRMPRTASTTSPSTHSYRTDSKVIRRTCASTD